MIFLFLLIKQNVSLPLSTEKHESGAHEVRKSGLAFAEAWSNAVSECALEQTCGAEAGQALSCHGPDFVVWCVVMVAPSMPHTSKQEFKRPLAACGEATSILHHQCHFWVTFSTSRSVLQVASGYYRNSPLSQLGPRSVLLEVLSRMWHGCSPNVIRHHC